MKRLILHVLLIVAAITVPAERAHGQVQGTIQQRSFIGPVLGNTVLFNIYLPPGYGQGATRYPVVYFLHGLDGSQGGPSNVFIPRSFEQAMGQGIIGPVIIVFANGYLNSLWADSIGGDKPAETDVVAQLIPYVDANFLTLSSRCSRAVMGFSMGGFGAPKFYAKFPHLFAACVAYDGSLVDWDMLVQLRPEWAEELFGNSLAYFMGFSPWFWAQENAASLRARDDLRLVVGSDVPVNRAYRDFLAGLGIACDYVETGCPHDMSCLLAQQGMASAAFLSLRLAPPIAGDLNGDGAVNTVDLTLFLGAFGQSVTPGWPGDLNGDGAVNTVDLTLFLGRFGQSC